MATVIYGTDSNNISWTYGGTVLMSASGSDVEEVPWDFLDGVDANIYDTRGTWFLVQVPPGAVESAYVNKVWDPLAGVGGEFVRWITYYIDYTGKEYPGPSLFGAVSGSYCVEHIKFGRSQGNVEVP